jgi:hypothetical protein
MPQKTGLLALAILASFALTACGKHKAKPTPAAETTLTSGTATANASTIGFKGEDGEDDSDAIVSCNSKSTDGMCAEWSGLGTGETKEAKGSCNEPGSVFSRARCSSDGLLATCEHKDDHVKMFLYKSALVKTIQGAKELCDDGEFTVSANALTPSRR